MPVLTRISQVLALLLVLMLLVALLPALWLPSLARYLTADQGLGDIDLQGVSWGIKGAHAKRLSWSFTESDMAYRVDAGPVVVPYRETADGQTLVEIDAVNVTVQPVDPGEAVAPAGERLSTGSGQEVTAAAETSVSATLLPRVKLKIGALQQNLMAQLAGSVVPIEIKNLVLATEPQKATLNLELSADAVQSFFLDTQISVTPDLEPTAIDISIEQGGTQREPLLLATARRDHQPDASDRYQVAIDLHAAPDAAELASVAEMLDSILGTQLGALGLNEVAINWQSEGFVHLGWDTPSEVAIDIRHDFEIQAATSELGLWRTKGALQHNADLQEQFLEVAETLSATGQLNNQGTAPDTFLLALNPEFKIRLTPELVSLRELSGRLRSQAMQSDIAFTLPSATLDTSSLSGEASLEMAIRSAVLGKKTTDLKLTAAISDNDGYRVSGSLLSERFSLKGQFDAALTAEDSWTWELNARSDDLPAVLERAVLFTTAFDDFEVDEGTLLVRHVAKLEGEQLDHRAQVDLLDVVGFYDGYPFEGLNLQAPLDLDQGAFSERDIALYIGQVDAVFPIFDITAGARLLPDTEGQERTLVVNMMRLSTLDGSVYIDEPFALALESWHADLKLQIEGLRLSQMFEFYGEDLIEAGGEIRGELPVRIRDDDIFIADGWAKNTELGGYIRYRLQDVDLGAQNQEANFAFQLLQDFNYSDLGAQLNLDPNGDLTISLLLDGHNPQVMDGQRVVFNVNVEQNIFQLLEAWRMTERYVEASGQRLRMQRMERGDRLTGDESSDQK